MSCWTGPGWPIPRARRPLRLEDGAVAVAITEGPFRTFAPHLRAYYLVSCSDMTRAGAIAARILDSRVTAVEVRPVHDSAHAE